MKNNEPVLKTMTVLEIGEYLEKVIDPERFEKVFERMCEYHKPEFNISWGGELDGATIVMADKNWQYLELDTSDECAYSENDEQMFELDSMFIRYLRIKVKEQWEKVNGK